MSWPYSPRMVPFPPPATGYGHRPYHYPGQPPITPLPHPIPAPKRPMPSPEAILPSPDALSSSRDDIPPQNDDLQKKFPGLYARLTGHETLQERLSGLGQASAAVKQAATLSPVRDHQLVALDDNMKRAGSVLIATLATLGLKQRVFGIGEYLGMMSWLGAMAATPRIVNGMVRLKTGVNLNQKYDSTYGQRQNLYKDPNYLPLHILPEGTIAKAAERLGIPPGSNRRQQVEDKMRQISVQTHTGWMLIAGPATPVLSGLACDQLQAPVTRLWNRLRLQMAMRSANAAKSASEPNTLTKHTNAALQRMVGELPESELSSWWRDFGSGIVDKSGIGRHLSIRNVTRNDHVRLSNQIAKFFGRSSELSAERVTETLRYLDRQYRRDPVSGAASGRLEDLRLRATRFLDSFRDRLPEAELQKQTSLVADRIQNAQSTVTHYRDLFKSVQASFQKDAANRSTRTKDATEAVTRWMRNTNYNAVSEMLESGRVEEAAKLVGRENPEIFKRIRLSGAKQGASLMGAAPEGHLIKALKEIKLGNLWRQKMVGWMGGGMLALSALYTLFFVGSDFKDPRSSGGAS